MKKLLSFLLFFVIIFNISSNANSANQPALKDALIINDIQILGNPIKGNNIQLKISFISNIDGEGEIELLFPKYIVLKNRKSDEIKNSKPIILKKGKEQQIVYNLFVEEDGESFLSVSFVLKNAPDGYNRAYYKYISVENYGNDYHIFNEHDTTTNKIKNIHPKRGSVNKSTVALQNYNISISGKIQYNDAHQLAVKGLYSNSVELWFRNSNDPNNWYHPVYSSDCTGTRHVHYDVVDANGNYSFNFSFTGDLSSYNQFIVIVSRSNDATYMPLQSNGIRVWCNNSYTDFFSLSEGVEQNIDGNSPTISVTNADVYVNPGDGAIFRDMMMSKEFVAQRYGGNLPFNLPIVYTIRTTLPEGIAGYFYTNDAHIEIDDNSTELSTTSHEFGHYINYKMWNDYLISDDGCSNGIGQTVPGTGKIYKEGWAIFYSFCVRNYANRVYNDNLRDWDDNTEAAPFESPRFNHIRYTSVDPNISAFACYLWNLYDEYNNGNFEASIYPGDNDDISGLSTLVFETMRTPINDCASKFNTQFNSGLSADIQTSVNDIYTFMFQDVGHSMRSAQIGNATANFISSSQIDFQWTPQSYSALYPYFNSNYGNYESGYKIYKNVNNNWQLQQTINYGTNNYSYIAGDIYGQYKITSYNSTGDSYNFAYFNFAPLSASISGPTNLSSGQTGTWSAGVSGGFPPYTYDWYYRYPSLLPKIPSINKPPAGYWILLGNHTSQITRYDTQDFELKCVITDNVSTTVTSNILYVSVGGGLAKNKNPEVYALEQNNPNPFNPTTTINYALKKDGFVTIKVFDILGREVVTLINHSKSAGYYSITFDAGKLSSGIYFYMIKTNDFYDRKKMVILK